MAFHSKDGTEFIGLRERNGLRQIIYDHRNGRRVIMCIEGDDDDNVAGLQDALRDAVSSKNVLGSTIASLVSRKLKYQIVSDELQANRRFP